MIRGESHISTIDYPIDSNKFLNPYRLGLDLAVSELSGDFDYYPTTDQIGTEPNDGLGNTGYQTNYRNAQVLDSYRVGSDHIASDNVGLGNLGT